MRDYDVAYRDFSIEALERQVLHGGLAGGVNACVECCDRWADEGRVALRWIRRDFSRKTVTFRELQEGAARFANLLAARGIGPGDTVAGLLPRIPELIVVALGTWRAGAVYQPLFTAFGPKAIEQRVTAAGGSQAKLIVTDAANVAKLDEVPDCPPVLLTDPDPGKPGTLGAELSRQPAEFAPVMLTGDDPLIILFTSGTTGHPKGVVYRLRQLLPFVWYLIVGLDLRDADRFWNVADAGWAYGMINAVLGPLMLGHATTFYDGPFTVEAAVRVIAEECITNLAAAPTVYRLMMAAGQEAMAPIAGQLRVASSAGEPLNPEVARWAAEVLGCPLHDHYGQTETAMVINNYHGLRHAVKPGSAGLTLPGFTLAILGDDLKPVPPNTPGVLAIDRARSPLMAFTGYWRAEAPNLQGAWYLSGDTMQQDEDGYFYFVGRSDDVITSAGYRIGPFDVESALMEHPAVAEVAVVGKPDPERTEIVKAFIVLRQGGEARDALAEELQNLVRRRLSLHAYPREIEFISELPKTPSGKVQRFVLRQRDSAAMG
jgi:acetyl-CoA synthetase